MNIVSGGDIDEAARFAELFVQIDAGHRIARLVLAIQAIKQKQYQVARAHLAASGAIAEDESATLLSAWAFYGTDERQAAIATIDGYTGPGYGGFSIFKEMHAGLILDLSNSTKEAGERLKAAGDSPSWSRDYPDTLRANEAYGNWLSRNVSTEEAVKFFQQIDELLPHDPLTMSALHALRSGELLPPLVQSVQEGAAEGLYDIGTSVGWQGDATELSLIYFKLANYLDPNQSLSLLSLGGYYQSIKQIQRAIDTYQKILDGSTLRRRAEIKIAINLDSLDRVSEAERLLERLIAEQPNDFESLKALGNILREHKRFSDCIEIYSKAIAIVANDPRRNQYIAGLGQENRNDWEIYFFRGICYERDRQWAAAEADLKKAAALFSVQPVILAIC
jgi:tetratricopeptide (TPR) repeat protein